MSISTYRAKRKKEREKEGASTAAVGRPTHSLRVCLTCKIVSFFSRFSLCLCMYKLLRHNRRERKEEAKRDDIKESVKTFSASVVFLYLSHIAYHYGGCGWDIVLCLWCVSAFECVPRRVVGNNLDFCLHYRSKAN